MVTDKDKTGQITEFRLTFNDYVVANEMYKSKVHFGYRNVSLTKRNQTQWAVNWNRK